MLVYRKGLWLRASLSAQTGIFGASTAIRWSIVARQAFLPGIDMKDAARALAGSRSLPVGCATLVRLAAAMPHSCRALTDRGTPTPPESPASVVLTGFLEQIVDGLIDQHVHRTVDLQFKVETEEVEGVRERA